MENLKTGHLAFLQFFLNSLVKLLGGGIEAGNERIPVINHICL